MRVGDTSEVEVIYQTKTDLAVCVREDEDSDRDIWIPLTYAKSSKPFRDLERGEAFWLEAPDWILEREGLI